MRANISVTLTIALAATFAFAFGETGHAAEQPAFAQGSGGAGQPRVLNGRLVPQGAGSGLDASFRRLVAAQTDPAWIGYSVPAVGSGERRLCCSGDTYISDGVVISNGRLATCGLEPGDRTVRTAQGQPLPNQ